MRQLKPKINNISTIFIFTSVCLSLQDMCARVCVCTCSVCCRVLSGVYSQIHFVAFFKIVCCCEDSEVIYSTVYEMCEDQSDVSLRCMVEADGGHCVVYGWKAESCGYVKDVNLFVVPIHIDLPARFNYVL